MAVRNLHEVSRIQEAGIEWTIDQAEPWFTKSFT